MFKYGTVDFVYVHQVVTSVARTDILFQNSLYIFKLMMIMLITNLLCSIGSAIMFIIPEIFEEKKCFYSSANTYTFPFFCGFKFVPVTAENM